MKWSRYYNAVEHSPARPTLLAALDAWQKPPGRALDLGCGSGRDTLELLNSGWHVIAVDAEAEALTRLDARLNTEQRTRLEVVCARFETLVLPAVDLVNASIALPFCPPAAFPALWQAIGAALSSGGLFAGHFFGERDDWATSGLTVLSREQLDAMLVGWKVISLDEIDKDGRTAIGKAKHWHLFELVAEKL